MGFNWSIRIYLDSSVSITKKKQIDGLCAQAATRRSVFHLIRLQQGAKIESLREPEQATQFASVLSEPMWHERDFAFQPKEHTRIFFTSAPQAIGRGSGSTGKKVCEHEGGYTGFHCEVTPVIKAGANFAVTAFDNTWHEDSVPNLKTDWWTMGTYPRSFSN